MIQEMPLITKEKHPSEAEFKAMYSAWIALRKKESGPLLRTFWKKPDLNDNSPNASFRSRVAEKIQTRRKNNKNDNSNYMKLKLLSKEIFSGRSLLGKVMEREKMKLAMLDLDYMELKEMLKQKTQPDYKCEEYKEFLQNESERIKVDYPKDMIEPERSEIGEEAKEEISSLAGESNANSMNESKRHDKSKIITHSQPKPDIPRTKIEHNSAPFSSQKVVDRPLNIPHQRQHPSNFSHMDSSGQHSTRYENNSNELVTVDPTTVMQISVLFKKLYYYGITADRNRIKINSMKPIKKEEYLNLTQEQFEEEQYQRMGVKPKPTKAVAPNTTDIKYTIFRARNGRVLIKRKPVGGSYETMENNSFTAFDRIKPESANNLKRLRSELDALDNFNKNTFIPVLQNEVNKRFKQFELLEDSEPDEEITDDASKENDVDDYTEGFINRYRKRKGQKRSNNNDLTISVRV